MDDWILSLMESALFLGMFFVSIYLLIPKSVHFWRLWKESGKTIHLSNAVASAVAAFFLLCANFLMFIKAIEN